MIVDVLRLIHTIRDALRRKKREDRAVLFARLLLASGPSTRTGRRKTRVASTGQQIS
ncbi:MAG: hypothetical protein KIT31_42405 [Deltaproteobacteria bacterium]|nr:hypothetical protein [Deltaproteobacteria bacterium]